jgi:hypothetical protein
MHRREFVASVAVIGSGCLKDDERNRTTNRTTNGTTDEAANKTDDTERENVAVADSERAVERYSEIISAAGGGAEVGDLTVSLGGYVAAGVLRSFDAGEIRGGARVDDAQDGTPLLRTALTNTGQREVEFAATTVPPYDGVAELRGGEEKASLHAVPTSGHDFFEEDADVARGDAVAETIVFKPRAGYVGEYELADDGLTEGVYIFEGPEGKADLEIEVWEAGSPGPDAESLFEGRDVSDVTELRETAWYHEADASTPVYLEPSEESVSLPATVEFTLVNHSEGYVSGNPSRWGLYKLSDGDWYQIAPWAHRLPAADYPPSERATYDVRLLHKEADEDARDGVRIVDRLGGGMYAYTVGMRRGEETNGAVFELDAPTVELDAPDDASVERDGARVTVTTGEARHDGKTTVERVDGDGERVLTEHIYRRPYRTLLYSVPFFDDETDEVVVRGFSEFGLVDEGNGVYTYDGRTYEVTTDG